MYYAPDPPEEKWRVISVNAPEYPPLLKTIEEPPKELFVLGDVSVLSKTCVGIVGARRATDYGKWAAGRLAKKLSDNGVVVVSGMAEGIDSQAHKGALEGSSPTIAVLGTGIDICFPSFNRGLRAKIISRGAVISEYSPGVQGAKYTFPQRNRIISGLSRALVVAEAGLSSGSLITAESAASQGREVYAIPGNINRSLSIGCNKLIRDGARALVFFDDLLSDMGISADIDKVVAEGLSDEERRIYEVSCANGELSIDDLARICRKETASISVTVTVLEMKGIVAYEHGRVIPLQQANK